MNSRHCKSKRIKRKWEKTKEHSKKRAWVVWGGIFPLFYQRLKLKKFDILVAHGEPNRDCFLAELLSAKAANNHLSGSRSCSSGLHHLWESGQGPQPQYKDWSLLSFWSGTPLPASPLHRKAKADLFCGSFIGLAIYWSLVSQLLPPHLSDVFLRKSLKTLETTYK